MLRNLNVTAGGRRILGVPTVGILSATIASETAGGDQGPGLLYDEAINPANAGKQLRIRITSGPGSGTLFVYENGSFNFDGAANGTYTIGYDWYADDVLGGSDTASVVVGAAPGVTLTGISGLTAGSATGTSAGTANGATLNGTSSLTAGTAIGGSGVVNGSASGATLTGTSSINAGIANGLSDNNPITASSMIKLAEIWARMELDATKPLVTSAMQLTVGTISQDISTGGAIRTGAALVPSIDPDTMIAEVWQRLGLDPDNALTQTNTSIDVGDIHLTVSGTDILTVQRV